jgi:tetratricopeptide (TPR) repeat protein
MDCFRSALAIDPRSEYAFLNLARCLRRVDRWEEAADLVRRHWLNRLHEADERVDKVGDFSAWMSRASAQGWLRRLAAVIEDLAEAARLAETSSDSARVQRSRMALAVDSGRFEEAHELAHQLAQDHAGDPLSLRASAHVAWLTGDRALAEQTARLAEHGELGERTQSVCRARAALATGRWRDAMREIEAQLEESLSGMLCCEHAEAAYASHKDGNSESARSYLRAAADENPNCHTLRALDQLELMPVRDLLPGEIQPWLLSEQPLA